MKFFNYIFWIGILLGFTLVFLLCQNRNIISLNDTAKDTLFDYKPALGSELMGIYDLVKNKNGLKEKIEEFGTIDSIIKFQIPSRYKVNIISRDTSNLKLIVRDALCINRFVVMLSNNIVSDYGNIYQDSIIIKCQEEQYQKDEAEK